MGADSRHVEPTVSPQIDAIIVDTLVPHSLWVVDDSSQGVEIVPREAVVGIIEVKRTLDVASVKSAVEHLGKIVNAVGIRKDDSVSLMPGGGVIGNGLTGPYRGNPLLGVIGLVAKGSFETTPGHTLYTAITQSSTPSLILDFALAMSGIFTATATPNTHNYEPLLVQDSLASAWAEASINTGTNGRVALAQGLGFIQAYIGKTCGRAADAEHYFFNDSIV